MTAIATDHGLVIGLHPELVAAAAALLDAISQPRTDHDTEAYDAVSWEALVA